MSFHSFRAAYGIEIEQVRLRLLKAFPELDAELLGFNDVATLLYRSTRRPVYIPPRELWL